MEKRTIVWIDDNADLIYATVRPLEREGYSVVTIRDLSEARRRIAELRTATLIILDLILPDGTRTSGYSGLTFLWELRYKYDIRTRVILLSVVAREKIVDKLSDLEVSAVLRKPIRPFDLKQKVGECLHLPREYDPRTP